MKNKLGELEYERLCLRLNEMVEMQNSLDERILGNEQFTTKYAKHKKLAFLTEVGEFMNERPDLFKYWKKDFKIDHEKALEEWVDIWHFALSIGIYKNKLLENRVTLNHSLLIDFTIVDDSIQGELLDFYKHGANMRCEHIISWLLAIGDMLGYSFEDVYKKYIFKNAKNHIRQQNGY